MKSLTLSLDISTTATGWAVFHGSDLVQSGVLKHKSKSFFERGRFMASELRAIQSRALQKSTTVILNRLWSRRTRSWGRISSP